MATYKTEAVIIKRQNFGEADKILTIFSKQYGKKKVIAKGVRRTTSRKGGNVELFNQVVLFLARGKTFDIVTEAQVVNSFEGFRRDLKRVSQAYYACELVDRLTAEDQEHREVFALLTGFLEYLSNLRNQSSGSARQFPHLGGEVCKHLRGVPWRAESAVLTHSFELQLLKLLGFWSLERVRKQGVSRGVLRVLEDLENVSFDQLRDLEIQPEILLELKRFLKYYIESIAEAQIKSAEFLNEVQHCHSGGTSSKRSASRWTDRI